MSFFDRAMSFFDEFPAFYRTSTTGAEPARLAKRHSMLITAQRSFISGRSVLDIASHDGRWSFAALKAGARHVTGIEARADLVGAAQQTFAEYGVSPERYKFVIGDFFERVREIPRGEINTIFCFGFLYHTLRHAELFQAMRGLDADTIILDTAVVPGGGRPLIDIGPEDARKQYAGTALAGAAADEALVGIPNVEAVKVLARYFGYQIEQLDWSPLTTIDKTGIENYAAKTRASFLLTARS